jgi:hypothetical protein
VFLELSSNAAVSISYMDDKLVKGKRLGMGLENEKITNVQE